VKDLCLLYAGEQLEIVLSEAVPLPLTSKLFIIDASIGRRAGCAVLDLRGQTIVRLTIARIMQIDVQRRDSVRSIRLKILQPRMRLINFAFIN